MTAQATVAAIRRGCELLSEGKAEIGKFKETVSKGVSDAKAIYKEVTGLWGWLKSLFGKKEAPVPVPETVAAVEPPKPVKKAQKPVEQLSYEEYETQAIHEVCEQLKTFFEIQRTLKAYCLDLEEQSKTTDTVEDSAIDRVQIELQLENMTVQIREAMVYAPKALRDIYSRFLKMYDQILEEQAFARNLAKKQERDKRWRREQETHQRIDIALMVTITAIVALEIWFLFLGLSTTLS